MKNTLLFIIVSLIWGSTWLVIKFQLGVVDPLLSIFYRFILAAAIIFVFSFLRRLNLKFSLKQHFYMALLGALLFGLNYWFVYLAELHLTSGVVAVVFSTIIIFNILFGALFLKSKIRWNVVFSAMLGFIGIALVFWDELLGFTFSSANSVAFMFALVGAISASLGNITSAYNQKNDLPVIQANAFGMLYGALIMLTLAFITGKPLTFDFSVSYVASLLYLAVFGSVVGFGSYLTLLGNIGADKAAYVTLVLPIIALLLSTIFEDYQWTALAMIGVVLITLGNILILRRKRV